MLLPNISAYPGWVLVASVLNPVNGTRPSVRISFGYLERCCHSAHYTLTSSSITLQYTMRRYKKDKLICWLPQGSVGFKQPQEKHLRMKTLPWTFLLLAARLEKVIGTK